LFGLAKAFVFPFYEQTGETTISLISKGQWELAINRIMAGLTGFSLYDNNFKIQRLAEGLFPLVAVGVGEKLLRKLGVNRLVKRGSMGIIEL